MFFLSILLVPGRSDGQAARGTGCLPEVPVRRADGAERTLRTGVSVLSDCDSRVQHRMKGE